MIRIRTGYSFRAAVGLLPDVMSRLVEIEASCAPITDRASAFGWPRWEKLAEKNNLRPIYGVELGVARDIHSRKLNVDYWTFIAIDDIKWLNRLIELASTQFHYEPQLTYEQAQNAEGVFKIVGHRSDLARIARRDDLFVGLAPSTSRGYAHDTLHAGHPLACVSDNKFPRPEDAGLYEAVCGRGASRQSYHQHIQSRDEWVGSVKHLVDWTQYSDAFFTSLRIIEQSTAKLRKARMLTPEKPKTLRQMCIEGAAKLGVTLDPVYQARLDRELQVIADKQFEDYFYIIADLMAFAKTRMICGPGRGSSAGSLVCYVLGITSVDPLKYNLLFERFIDITRDDLPDIDLDFSDQKRYLVFDYMEKKYGRDRVARLGTVALFRPRSALFQCAAAISIPQPAIDKVIEALILRPAGDARAFRTLQDTLETVPAGKEVYEAWPELRVAARMEGHPRHSSSHAAGLMVTDVPVYDIVAIDRRTGATHCDKVDAEALNLLKIDALGLTQLSIFEDTIEAAGLPFDHLDHIPFDDVQAFEVINKGRFCGISQFNGSALQNICREIKVVDLEDIIAITALARPGPLGSGGTQQWIARKKGETPVTYPHPLFEPYLQNTLGIITYQEQVMQIAREIGGFSWEDVSRLRRAISKSMGAEYLEQWGAPFKQGAMARGVPEEVAERVWADMCSYGSYGFNRAHAVAYGIVSYWCAWFKAHYPLQFAAATLTHEPLPEKQIVILRELALDGIGYIPIDVVRSTNKWSIGSAVRGLVIGAEPAVPQKVLIGPVQNIRGVGPKMVETIMSSRVRGEELPQRVQKLLYQATTQIDSLWPIRDTFHRLMPVPSMFNIVSSPTPVSQLQCESKDYQATVFVVLTKINVRDENARAIEQKKDWKVDEHHPHSLTFRAVDDTGDIFAMVDRYQFDRLGRPIADRGQPGKGLYVLRGTVPSNFRMLRVERVRFIGMINDKELVRTFGEEFDDEPTFQSY